ncbi:MAG: hypothetical protein ACTSRR_07305 [Candidatus Heimdallarchaeaceae archaeon]
MKQTFQRYPDLESYLERTAHGIMSLVEPYSVLSYGCLTLDDFSKKYSTIELIVILKKGLWAQDYDKISEIVDFIFSINNEYAEKTLIYFLPLEMIENPRVKFDNLEGMKIHGKEQEIVTNYPLSPIDDFLVREKGETIAGAEMRELFPLPPSEFFWNAFVENIVLIEKWTKEYPFQQTANPDYFIAVNRLLYFPRLLYSIKEKGVIGKTKVVYWFSSEYQNEIGDFIVEVGVSRKKDLPLVNILDIEEKSMKLLDFCIKEVLTTHKVKYNGLSDLIIKREEAYDYSRFFMEIRNLLI